MSMESPNNVNNIDPAAAGGSGTASGDVAFTDTSGALSVASSVADGASAVAVSVDTENTLTEGAGAKLMRLSNNGTTRFDFRPRGSLELFTSDIEGVYVEGANNNSADYNADSLDIFNGGTMAVFFNTGAGDGQTVYTFTAVTPHASGYIVEVKNGTNTHFAIGVASAGQTGLFLWDADNSTLQQVSLGAPDSGGSGFRSLVIPNAP